MTAGTIGQPRGEAAAHRAWSASSLPLLLPFVAIVGVAAANGGFDATSFGWTALAFAWVVIIAVTITTPAWAAFDVVWLAVAGAVSVYTFASAAWAGSAAAAFDSGLRSLVYLSGIAGALLVLRRGRTSLWLGGLALGASAVCSYSLATRLFPNRFGAATAESGYRLFVPLGYWNALGIFAAIGSLLALGVTTLGRGRVLRILTALGLVPLTSTLYFTFSRGAWLALAVGLLAMFVLSSMRLRLLAGSIALVPIPAAGVLLASGASGLTRQATALSDAAHAGHGLAFGFAVLTVAQAIVAAAYVVWVSRVKVSTSVRRAVGAVAVAAVLGALIGVFTAYGAPPTLARHAYDSFVSPPPGGTDLNGRLFTLSNHGRTVLWRAALDDFRAHPVVGSGAGSFGRWWLAHRTTFYSVGEAHDLYVQTLAEGGAVGLGLLVALLGLPLIAAVRGRRHPLVAPAFGAYVAFLVHAAVEWDWQMPAVTLLALFAAAVPVAAARGSEQRAQSGRVSSRVVVGAAAALIAVVSFVGLIGNIALARAQSGILNGGGRKAVGDAANAHRWAPWSAPALRALGESRVLAADKPGGLDALRHAAAKDPGDWQTWFDIAVVTSGAERQAALARVRSLNPQGQELTTAIVVGR